VWLNISLQENRIATQLCEIICFKIAPVEAQQWQIKRT